MRQKKNNAVTEKEKMVSEYRKASECKKNDKIQSLQKTKPSNVYHLELN